jgi:hypothetical protein
MPVESHSEKAETESDSLKGSLMFANILKMFSSEIKVSRVLLSSHFAESTHQLVVLEKSFSPKIEIVSARMFSKAEWTIKNECEC